MNGVIDVDEAGTDATVLTETEGGGLLGRSLLHDGPLSARLDEAETPRYVLRNKKQGVTVERPDGTEEYAPVGRYSGLALVSDARVLFAVGGSEGDRTLSVPLADVVDVRTEEGMLGGAVVVETVDDARYRFPCRGDLDPVAEYLDAAAGVWARAEAALERAEDRLDDLYGTLDSGNPDVVLAGIEEARALLDEAREEATELDAARTRVDGQADDVADELATLERRAHVARAGQARERARVRWDDQAYEAAFDHLDEAAAAYEAAADVDAGQPDDDLADEREALADERARLAAAPVDRAEDAVDVAVSTDEPSAAVDWWERAVERYDAALSLDWGRDDRRFEGDPADLRANLADAAANLVSAYCALARDHIESAEDDHEADPESARVAYDLAAEALEEARAVARERAPDATDEVAAVEETLEERRADLPAPGERPRSEFERNWVTFRDAADPTAEDAGEREAAGDDPGVGIGDGASGSEGDVEGEGAGDAATAAERTDGRVTDPGSVAAEQFPTLVAALFERTNWSATLFRSGRESQYDLLAETDAPVGVTACVWTVHPDDAAAVDAAQVERYAAYAERADEADAAVLVSAAPLSPAARERATEYGVVVLDADGLAERLAEYEVRLSDF